MSDNKGEEVTLEEASRTSSVEGEAGEDSLRKAQESGSDGLEAGVLCSVDCPLTFSLISPTFPLVLSSQDCPLVLSWSLPSPFIYSQPH